MSRLSLRNFYFGLQKKMRCKAWKKYASEAAKRNVKGEKPLTKEQKKAVKSFYAPYTKVTTLYHHLYYAKLGVFSERFLPHDLYYNVIDEYFNPNVEAKFVDNKCYYRNIFMGMKQPDTVVMRTGGFWCDSDMRLISQERLRELAEGEAAIFAKAATNSVGGKGVAYISSENGSVYTQLVDFAKTLTGDIVVQRPVKQHKEICRINETSVNTIRCMSLLTEDGAKIYSSIMRIGIKGMRVDNASSGGLTIGINPDGTLKKYAHNSNVEEIDRHPSNDFVFEGFQIPSFDKALEFVKRAHEFAPRFRLISFDIAIDDEGDPVLIEANLHKGGLNLHQYNNGPIFGDDTAKILDEVFGKSKKYEDNI